QLSPGSRRVASETGHVEPGCPGLNVSGTAVVSTDTNSGWELVSVIVMVNSVVEPKGWLPKLSWCGVTSSAGPAARAVGAHARTTAATVSAIDPNGMRDR